MSPDLTMYSPDNMAFLLRPLTNILLSVIMDEYNLGVTVPKTVNNGKGVLAGISAPEYISNNESKMDLLLNINNQDYFATLTVCQDKGQPSPYRVHYTMYGDLECTKPLYRSTKTHTFPINPKNCQEQDILNLIDNKLQLSGKINFWLQSSVKHIMGKSYITNFDARLAYNASMFDPLPVDKNQNYDPYNPAYCQQFPHLLNNYDLMTAAFTQVLTTFPLSLTPLPQSKCPPRNEYPLGIQPLMLENKAYGFSFEPLTYKNMKGSYNFMGPNFAGYIFRTDKPYCNIAQMNLGDTYLSHNLLATRKDMVDTYHEVLNAYYEKLRLEFSYMNSYYDGVRLPTE